MVPTPDLSHLSSKDYDLVYEPAEDTFLLLDALEADQDALRAARPRICLEIGSGSGCVSTFLSKILGASSAAYICTDINPHAGRATRATGRQNQAELDPVNTAFAHPLRQRLRHHVDVIVFNPPYVPTADEEAYLAQEEGGIGGAWAGGGNGMAVTNIFLEQVGELLSPSGQFYLVSLKQNNIPEIRALMLERHQLKSRVVIERRAGGEYLYILAFTRYSAVSIRPTPDSLAGVSGRLATAPSTATKRPRDSVEEPCSQ